MTDTDISPAIVPSFDSEAGPGRKLAIICSKGSLDMAYPGLILANAALGLVVVELGDDRFCSAGHGCHVLRVWVGCGGRGGQTQPAGLGRPAM